MFFVPWTFHLCSQVLCWSLIIVNCVC
uniref:Uncharacterized protein n=1 Tax=Anguilla anguilla TaxID=7936 RepID=A0A0E9Y0L8_ANGAN